MTPTRNNIKRTPIPVVPRQMKLVNPDGTPTRSGQLLLEQTLADSVSYGPPGAMSDTSGLQDGALYVVEQSGTQVLYQLQGGEWHYIAGTMWGTVHPDQRPVGLGVNDAGFTFRTIDGDPTYSARIYIWSGSAWIDATAVRYGTHSDRLAAFTGTTMNGMVWVETDRSEVIYQLQGSSWHFLAGTMWGTVSPDQRPTDLGPNDAGFAFRGTDQQREFIWSGTVWVEVTPPQAGLLLFAASTGSLVLTTTTAVVPGAVVTLSRAGRYLITGNYLFNATDTGVLYRGGISIAGVDQGNPASLSIGLTGQYMMGTQQWSYQATAGQQAQLNGSKGSGTGSAVIAAPYSTISALWVSP